MIKLFVILLVIPIFGIAQTIQKYEPSKLYDRGHGLYDKDSLRSLYINIYESNFNEILDQYWKDKEDSYLPAKIYLGVDSLDSVGIRYKGNFTYFATRDFNNPKKPFNIDINEYVKNQTLKNTSKLKLSNSLLDPTFIKEISALNFYKKYLPTPEANLMQVYLNDEYLGVYVNIEPIDKNFLKKHFGEKDGVLFKCDPTQKYEESKNIDWSTLEWKGQDSINYLKSYKLKSEYGWSELINLIDILNNEVNNIESILNVDRVLWYFALNSVLLNLDSYNAILAHNYYLYKTEDGLFQIIPWDLSEAYVAGLFGLSYPELKFRIELFHGLTPFYEDRPLSYQLFSDSIYSKQYIAHVRTIMNEFYGGEYLESIVPKLQLLAKDAVFLDSNKLFSNENFSINLDSTITIIDEKLNKFFMYIGGVFNILENRYTYLVADENIKKIPPKIIDINIAESETIITTKVENATEVELRATISKYNSNFQSFMMQDDGLGSDKYSNDGIYSAYIPFVNSKNKVKFYIRASNKEAMMLSPERAEYEFYTIIPTPGDIVINELMANNVSTATDPSGEYDDWLELYNNTEKDIFLSDYYLSDNIEILDKWKIPDLYIKKNDYLIIWADKDTDQEGLHANFKLSSEGESLFLMKKNKIIDVVTFYQQNEDISYGRYPNGLGSFSKMKPTFLSENFKLKISVNDNSHKSILSQNYPNPFQTSTQIKFKVDKSDNLKIIIYNSKGEQIKVLTNKYYQKGEYSLTWDGKNNLSQKVKPGIYVYIIFKNKTIEVKKMVFIK